MGRSGTTSTLWWSNSWRIRRRVSSKHATMAVFDDPDPAKAVPTELVDEVEFLRRGILLGEGFQLYLVGAESLDARQRAIEQLLSTPGLAIATVTGEDFAGNSLAGVIAEAFAKLVGKEGRPVVVVAAIDEMVADDPRLLTRLNEQRSEFIAGSTGAVVILATPRVIAGIRRLAPDTWSVRAADLDVNALAPAPQNSDIAPRLQPIQPPDREERWDVEATLDKAAVGDEAGRAALRLAEIYEFERASDRSVALLYLQAAENIKDRWLAVLARVNAGRALTRAGNQAGATLAIDQALHEARALDHGICSYVLASLVENRLAFGIPEGALEAADEAIQEAAKSLDGDLLAEARLSRASIHRRLSRLEKALADAKAAEAEALAVGNLPLAQAARVVLGALAAEAGFSRQAVGSWERYLETANRQEADTFRALVAQIGSMEESSATNAAVEGWTVLTNLAERSGDQKALGAGIISYVSKRVLWESKQIDLPPWYLRLESLLPAPDYESYRPILDFLTVREALNRSDIEAVRDTSVSAFANLESFQLDYFTTGIVRLTHLALLALTGQANAARSQLHAMLEETESRSLVFEYLAAQARNRSSRDELALPDRVVVALVLEWLGGIESARYLGTLLTGGTAGEAVDTFLNKISRSNNALHLTAASIPILAVKYSQPAWAAELPDNRNNITTHELGNQT